MKIWLIRLTWADIEDPSPRYEMFTHYPNLFIDFVKRQGAVVDVKSTYWDLIPDSGE